MSDLTPAELIRRPNGKTYRPRVAPTTSLYANSNDDTGVMVARAFTQASALRIAERVHGAGVWDEYGLDRDHPEFGWWREAIRRGDPHWVEDETTGVPCFFWEPA